VRCRSVETAQAKKQQQQQQQTDCRDGYRPGTCVRNGQKNNVITLPTIALTTEQWRSTTLDVNGTRNGGVRNNNANYD